MTELQYKLLLAQLGLAKLEDSAVRSIQALLRRIELDAISLTEKNDVMGVTRTAYQQARYETLMKEIQVMLSDGYKKVSSTSTQLLIDIADSAQKATASVINTVLQAEVITLLPVETLKVLVGDALIQGAPSREWWKQQNVAVAQRFANTIRQGMAQGLTTDELVQRVRGKAETAKHPAISGVMDASKRNAEALVRTSVQTVANQAHLDLYAANDDLVDGIQWLATLDNKTTPICRRLDGLAWDLERKPIGEHSEVFPGPTAHWGCRSTQIPYLKPWDQVIENKKLAKKLQDWEDNATRASMFGQVPGKVTYAEWEKLQSAKK